MSSMAFTAGRLAGMACLAVHHNPKAGHTPVGNSQNQAGGLTHNGVVCLRVPLRKSKVP